MMAITNDYEYNEWDSRWRAQATRIYEQYTKRSILPTCMLYPQLPRSEVLRKQNIGVILILDKKESVIGLMMYREHLLHLHSGLYEVFCLEVDQSVTEKNHLRGEMLRAARALEPGLKLLVTCSVSDTEMMKFASTSKASRMYMEQFVF